jgi:hypothetical protein
VERFERTRASGSALLLSGDPLLPEGREASGDGAGRAGVTPQALLDAPRNPANIMAGVDSLGRPYRIFTGRDARVVVNPNTGQVISVNPLSGPGAAR